MSAHSPSRDRDHEVDWFRRFPNGGTVYVAQPDDTVKDDTVEDD